MTSSDPMSEGYPMNEADLMGVRGGNVANVGAREAIAQAMRRTASARERHALVARLALRLAELGHTKNVTFRAAGGAQTARAVLSFLADPARAHEAGDLQGRRRR